jgi:glutathione synthase/RimK-type ligase-like ATP-grasp enzyme
MNPIIKKKASSLKVLPKKKPTHFYLRIFSRHPTSKDLRDAILIPGKKVVYRHGSTTEGDYEYEINSTETVRTSADKKLMKEAFNKAEVRQAMWLPLSSAINDKANFDEFVKKLVLSEKDKKFAIIKHRMGSRGTGNYLIKTKQELDNFIAGHKNHLDNYIIEQYKNFSVEYRLHVSELGCFYACRKVLKKDTPASERFQRHDDNCSWLIESNPGFEKPENWDEIVKDCIKIVKAMGGDVLAFDVKCTAKPNKESKRDWIIIETCSAPAFGKITTEKYREHLPKIINHKYGSKA